jgi:hypothetical protein
VWQWYNCCSARAPAGKSLLRINLDETSVCLFQGGGRGTVLFNKRKQPLAEEPRERASRAKRRACLTHVAFVCDRSDIQAVLPQVLIGNQATFLARDFDALQASCPRNVHLIRQKSAWNNKAVMVRILAFLAVALNPFRSTLQPVLLLDACKVHIHTATLQRSIALGIWPIVVPARLTWLLQPLDTHVFLRFQFYLKTAYQSARVRLESQELSVAEFLACTFSAIRHILQGNAWAAAFDADGFGDGQRQISPFIQRQLQLTDALALPATMPTEEHLQHCFPKGWKVPHRSLLRPLQIFSQPKALPKAPVGLRLGWLPPVLPDGSPVAPGASPKAAVAKPIMCGPGSLPMRGPRTRSETRLAAALAKGRPVPKSAP